MKYFSLFSGVGGFEIGLDRLDLECVGFSEIDKYASAVLAYRYPNIKNYGDITKISTKDIPDFDILIGGSPCQDLSVAGKQKGLDGERSGLFFYYVEILKAKKPRYFIWENVKGALSSNGGWDFAKVQIEFSEAGYDITWQVLNASDFGVPQNRERIFIVGHLRGERGGKVLHITRDTTKTLEELTRKQSQGNRIYSIEGLSTSICSNAGGLGAKTGLYAISVVRDKKSGQRHIVPTNKFSTLTATYSKGIQADGRPGVAVPVLTPERVNRRQNGRRFKTDNEPMFTLTAQDKHGIYNGYRVRKLLPVECERLMSWEDEWTKYGDFNGVIKEISDTQRYKMCGNGVVSNCVYAIAKDLLDNVSLT